MWASEGRGSPKLSTLKSLGSSLRSRGHAFQALSCRDPDRAVRGPRVQTRCSSRFAEGKSRLRKAEGHGSKSHSKSGAELASGLSRASCHQIPPAHGLPPGAADIPRNLVTGKEMSAEPVPMFGLPS